MKKLPAASLALLLFASCQDSANQVENSFDYPNTRKVEQVDDYHGQAIQDPYRWLENDTSKETEAWVIAQNRVTFSYLEQIPFRKNIRNRMDELLNHARQSAPTKAGNYYFYTHNDGLQNQSVIYMKKGIDGAPEVFIDPNAHSEKGTITFSLSGFSKDKSLVTVSKSESGSDWREFIVYDVASKKPIGDTLKWVKFSGASWYKDGFFYSRYPAPESGSDYSASNSFHSVYYHKIGTEQIHDVLVFEDKEHPNRYHSVDVTEDGKYLILYIAEGTDGYECHYKVLGIPNSTFVPLFTGFDRKNSVVDHIEGKFYVRTDIDAPRYRLVAFSPDKIGKEHWTDIIPQGDHLLESVQSAAGLFFAKYLENAQSKIYRLNIDGSDKRAIDLPPAVSAYGFGGEKNDTLLFYGYSSFTSPGRIYSYNTLTEKSNLYYESAASFNPDDFESKQVFYKSKDGTSVSMFVVHKKGLELDGNNPCLLYGYGGFNISLKPGFKSTLIPWLENNAVYAMPNLRGGGEYGEEWHQGGMLLNKQNVFDDFISAAEYLITEKYTSSDKLIVSGRSNGGLLVGAIMTQRPELMKVALPGVGVMDMLRYQKFTVGHGWIPEYGSSDEAVHFQNLVRFSPLHNLKEGVNYPATLVYTGDHDDRVVPAHSFKFAATLQEMNDGNNPVMIRIETDAGHGSGKPISKLLDEEADKMAFSFYAIGATAYSEN